MRILSKPTDVRFTDVFASITKLMGESFKLHSQALVGYEDSMAQQNNGTSQHIPAPQAPEVVAY